MQHNQRPHLPPSLNLEHEQEQFDDLASTYRTRLDIDPSVGPLPPNADTLRLLVERHLRHVPFENLSLHGAGGGRRPHVAKDEDEDKDYEDCEDENDEPAIPLAISTLINKILHRKRGGCCFELNGLLGHFLLCQGLGYHVVRLVPCWVYAGPERGHSHSKKAKFRTRQSHAFLFVRTRNLAAACSEDEEDGSVDRVRGGDGDGDGKGHGESYILDVGLGEPPLHPLRYGPEWLGVEQITPEGMRSRIVREDKDWVDGSGRVRRCCRLEWWVPCRRCHQRSHELGSSAGCNENSDGNTASTNADNTVEAKRLALLNTAKELRVAADKARRKSKAKPRSAYKVYASDPTVRDQATLRLVDKFRLREEKKQKQTTTGNGHVTTRDTATDEESSSPAATVTSTAFEPSEIHREICVMWADLDDNGRAAYSDKALEEMESLREEAHRAEVKAAIAEGDAKRAMKEHGVDDDASASSGTYACCNDPSSRCGGNGGYWEPRLQWDVSDAPLIPPLEEGGSEPSFIDDAALSTFANVVDIICEEGSTFVKKAVVCVLTREEKVTLSGNVLKVTSPRFPKGSDGPVQTCIELESLQEARVVLQDRFGIPLQETEGLNLLGDDSEPSAHVGSAKLWEHL